MWPDSLSWQRRAWTHHANLLFLCLRLTTWPLAAPGFKHPLYPPQRLLYDCFSEINERGEGNKGSF